MKYGKIVKGRFLSRPNRFIALVDINGEVAAAHVKNTGRCKELLVPNTTVYLEDFKNNMGSRKLAYSLVTVEKQTKNASLLINMDSQAPNKVIFEALNNGTVILPNLNRFQTIKPEAVWGNSRLDFFIEDSSGKKAFIEVKGVTLEQDGVVSFPDAPTARGIKHIDHLISLKNQGFEAFIIFVIQMEGVKYFTPNNRTHPEFSKALRNAKENGVNILAFDCKVTENSLLINKEVSIKL